MTAFRAAAVYDSSGGAQAKLEKLLRRCLGDRANMDALSFQDPAESPIMAAAINRRALPTLGHAIHRNGSFIIIDGDIHDPHTTAEELLRSYLTNGEAFYAELNAAAAVLLWDSPQRRLTVYRDRAGTVPSFFAAESNGLIWSSNTNALLKYGVSPDINIAALDFFLGAGFIPAPWSMASRISKIPPAYMLSISPGAEPELRRYWRPRGRPKRPEPMADRVNAIEGLFEQSLKRQLDLTEDKKIGVLVSSGVDSKLVLAGLARIRDDIEAFTIRYTDYEGIYNESPVARSFAEYCGVRHDEIPFRPRDVSDRLEWFVRQYGEPLSFGIHTGVLDGIAERGISTIFSGGGAERWDLDDWDKKAIRYRRQLRYLAPPVAALLNRIDRGTWPSVLSRANAACGASAHLLGELHCAAKWRVAWRFALINPPHGRNALYSDRKIFEKERAEQDRLILAEGKIFQEENSEDEVLFMHHHFRSSETFYYWNNCWSRAYGLTVRYPYLDRDFQDYMSRLPRDSHDKEEIRRLALSYMTHDMAYSPKTSQTVPLGHWFKGPLKEFLLDQLSAARIKDFGIFEQGEISRLLGEHISGKRDHTWKLWTLITVLVWRDLAARRDW